MDGLGQTYGEAARAAAGFFWKAGWAFALAVLDGLIVFGFTATGYNPQTLPTERRRIMLYARETGGSVQDVAERLEESVKEHHFGVLGRIDLKAKMADKGVPFDHECVILEVCNPKQAKKVLEQDLAVSTSLPCRVSVYEQDGKVTVATVKPTVLLAMYEGADDLKPVAQDVEKTLIAIIDAACEF